MATPMFQGTFSWILFIVFLVFFLPWCWFTGKSLKAALTYEATIGTIQDAAYVPPDSSLASRDRPLSSVGVYTHQAIFSSKDGRTHQVFTRVRSNPPAFEIGDQVKVYYDAGDPDKAIIGTFTEMWFPTLTLGFFTFIFFILWYGALVSPPTPLHEQLRQDQGISR